MAPASIHARFARGFTLIELVMVIVILGVLAATALPRFVALQRDARVAKVEDMAGRLMTFATHVHLKCSVTPSCSLTAAPQFTSLPGIGNIILHFGWPDAGDFVNDRQIDAFITTVGYTVSVTGGTITIFALTSAPDPANCVANYHDAHGEASKTARVSTITTGC